MHTLILTLALAAAPVNLYVSPTGSDSNSCLNAARPCATVNTAIDKAHKLAGPYVNAPINIYVASGSYYAPLALSDGGAPDPASAMGLIDIEGFAFGPNGSFTIDCAIQSLSNGLSAAFLDGGAVSGKHSQEWVQVAPPVGGWGGYAVDAGYAYSDGGLIANALKGEFLQATGGKGVGDVFPIVNNDLTTISFVRGSNASNPFDITTTISLYAPASHFYPYPLGGSPSNSYSEADLYVAGNSAETSNGVLLLSGYTATATPGNVNLYYCDMANSVSARSHSYSTVEVRGPGLLFFAYGSVEADAPSYGAALTLIGSAPAVFQYSSITGGFNVADLWDTSRLYFTADYVTEPPQQSAFLVVNSRSTASVEGSVLSTASLPSYSEMIALASSSLWLGYTDLDTGGAGSDVIGARQGSFVYASGDSFDGDGGTGILLLSGASNANVSATSNTYNASSNLVSLDNGNTWTTATTYSTNDAGAAGQHSICNAQWGTCITNK